MKLNKYNIILKLKKERLELFETMIKEMREEIEFIKERKKEKMEEMSERFCEKLYNDIIGEDEKNNK